MAKGYWIAAYRSVADQDKLAAYRALSGPAIEAAGGRFLARGGAVTAHEAGVEDRTVLVEFDSYALAMAAYDSDAYRAALAALDGGAERDVRIVEGID
jgi:uncharacterized protein (DUF1330 family)